MIVCTGSFKPGYPTYCAQCHRVQAVQRPRIRCDGRRPSRRSRNNRMLAAERQESTVRVQPRAGPPQATSSGWFRVSELLLGAPLSRQCSHHSESAADALCCLPPARHRRWGLEIQPDLHSYCCCFRSLAYSMAYSMLPFSHLFVVYSRGAISHMCYIAGCHITPFCSK